MIVSRSIREVRCDANSYVTVGTFDGVHVGHRAIIDDVCRRARDVAGRSVLITFEPHPREVVGRGPVQYLTPLDERLELLATTGIDETHVIEFTYEFSRLTSRQFYEDYLVRYIGLRGVVVGHDHMFGRDREADIGRVQQLGDEMGFTAHECPPVTVDGRIISSSVIREHLLNGDIELANRYLDRPYTLKGSVVGGEGRGARLGFPTANVQLYNPKKLVPASGVYIVRIMHGARRMFGMLNIGLRPTFDDAQPRRTIEANIFDFSGALYGESVEVAFLKRLRAEQKFSSAGELVAQIGRDKEESVRFLKDMYQP